MQIGNGIQKTKLNCMKIRESGEYIPNVEQQTDLLGYFYKLSEIGISQNLSLTSHLFNSKIPNNCTKSIEFMPINPFY